MARWNHLADEALAGNTLTREDAMSVLQADDDELLALLHAAFRVRKRFYGRDVRLHVLRNAKSGLCRENCKFCSQAMGAQSGVERYRMQTPSDSVTGRGVAGCEEKRPVSGRGPYSSTPLVNVTHF